MPNKYNFSELNEIKELQVNPINWVNPLIIEYTIDNNVYYWRVKGTSHTFTIPVKRMNYITSGNYVKHFEEALQNFREDYIEWKNSGFITEWMREYEFEYKRFIL